MKGTISPELKAIMADREKWRIFNNAFLGWVRNSELVINFPDGDQVRMAAPGRPKQRRKKREDPFAYEKRSLAFAAGFVLIGLSSAAFLFGYSFTFR